MAGEDISDEVKRFILKSVISIPYLEALLLLRDNPDDLWEVDQVAGRLYVSPAIAAGLLTQLHESGFIEQAQAPRPTYRYAPKTAPQGEIVDQVAQAYARHLVAVTNLIHSRSTSNAQRFADAFLIRKDPSS